MKNDINTLSGVEFENLCQSLLHKAGFEIEITKQSGDGGIDLIAFYKQSFLAGKYIVQCKRYTGSVGEPILRDLYGVVTAERANKGILITTGYFTLSAIRFANDKNLELIDGEQLVKLLSEYKLLTDIKHAKYDHFTQHDCFDARKYEFYKGMIHQNLCTIEMGRDFLFVFMFKYMTGVGSSIELNNMLHSGFADEYLKLFSWYTGKYYKRGKVKLESLSLYIKKYKGLAQLLNFDVFEYIQARYVNLTSKFDIEISYHREGDYWSDGRKHYSCYNLSVLHKSDLPSYMEMQPEIMANLYDENRVIIRPQKYPFYELLNLLSIFAYFKLQSGVEQIHKLFFDETPEFKQWFESKDVYQDSISNLKIYYSKIVNTFYGYEIYEEEETAEGFIDLTLYYNMYSGKYKEKIHSEISKVEELLLTLNSLTVKSSS